MQPVSDVTGDLERWKDVLTPALYGFAVVAILAESLFFAYSGRPRHARSRWLGIQCGLLAFGTGAAVSKLALFGVQTFAYQHRLFDLGVHWYTWVVCLVLNDLMFYVSHRLQHEVQLLWGVHAVHHSSTHYDLTAGVRGSVFDALVELPFYAWIPLLGIHPLVVLIVETVFRFYGLTYHTELVGKLGVLDEILVTPSNHRVHHGSDVQYLDCNYGGLFIVWDRLFGTFRRETKRPTYGLTKPWQGIGLVDCQLHVLADLWRRTRAVPSVLGKIRFLLKAPA